MRRNTPNTRNVLVFHVLIADITLLTGRSKLAVHLRTNYFFPDIKDLLHVSYLNKYVYNGCPRVYRLNNISRVGEDGTLLAHNIQIS